MNRLFDMDNGFFRFMGKVFDMIVLNLIVLVMCVPVITIGPALTAGYYVAMKTVRDEEGYVWKSFFKSFKQNFLQGFILEIIVAVAAVLMYVDLRVTYNWMSESSSFLIRLLFYVLVGFALLVAVSASYVFPVLAKFENNIKKILMNSVMMAVRHLQYSVLLVILTAGAGVLVYIYPISVFFVVGFVLYINSYIFRKIFDNYIKVDSQGREETDREQVSAEKADTGEAGTDTEDTEDKDK